MTVKSTDRFAELPSSPRQTIIADGLLALDPELIAFCPPRLQNIDPHKNPSLVGFGVLHLGKALLRAADGSETLIDDQTGVHYLGSDIAVAKELQAREWPNYAFSEYEQEQLEVLGIEPHRFPVMAYEVPYHRVLHRVGRQRHPVLPRVARCQPNNRFPTFSDMDPTSRSYLEGILGGINLRRNRIGHQAPVVRIGDQEHMLTSSTSLIRNSEVPERCTASEALDLIYSYRRLAKAMDA